MSKCNANNERIKKVYFKYLKEAKLRNEATINEVRKSINRFEQYTCFKDFKTFNKDQAIGFKKKFASQISKVTGERISKSTMAHTANNLKGFFEWLSCQKGYHSRVKRLDVEYINFGDVSTRGDIYKSFPSLEQVRKVIFNMPDNTDIEKRNKALIAFVMLTGCRVTAVTSLKLKHVDLEGGLVRQDARDVKTKFSKNINTFFFQVGDDIKQIFAEWVTYLMKEKLYGFNDPLFPQTRLEQDNNHSFKPVGLEPKHWNTTTPIRGIFRNAFQRVGMSYYNPHRLRDTLVHLGEKICKTPEEFKAWSQNLGHEKTRTTFDSYGNINPYRQGEIILKLKAETTTL